MQRRVKTFVRRSLGRVAPLAFRLRQSPALLILTYHRVLPAGHPARRLEQPGMYVSPESLAMHLRVLARYFHLMDLGEWLARRTAGTALPDRACCLTFDDGWRDNYEFGLPVLRAAGVPATIFLVADAIGGPYRFWPNRLAALLDSPGPDRLAGLPCEMSRVLLQAGVIGDGTGGPDATGRIDAAINACKQLPDAAIIAMLDEAEVLAGVTAAPGQRDLLDAEEILAMRASGMVRFGSHSRRHTRLLPTLPPALLDDEVRVSRLRLESLLGEAVAVFCYPNGDCPAEAVAAARRTYTAAVTTVSGWNRADSDLMRLRRISLHEDIARDKLAFLARIAGLC